MLHNWQILGMEGEINCPKGHADAHVFDRKCL